MCGSAARSVDRGACFENGGHLGQLRASFIHSLGVWKLLSLRRSSAEMTPSARSLPQERQSRFGKGFETGKGQWVLLSAHGAAIP